MPHKKLYEVNSKFEINKMNEIGGIVLYNILKGRLKDDEKLKLYKQLKVFELLHNDPSNSDRIYKGKYNDIKILYEENKDGGSAENKYTHTEPVNNIYEEMLKNMKVNEYVYHDTYEKPIKEMQNALKIISKHLNEYLDQLELDENDFGGDNSQIFIIKYYKRMIDDLATGKFKDKLVRNPAYLYAWYLVTTQIPTNKPQILVENNENGEITLKAVNNNKVNWKRVADNIYNSVIFDVIEAADDLEDTLDKFETTGESDRKELINTYKKYKDEIQKLSELSRDEYDEIKNSGIIQCDFDELTTGHNYGINSLYDTEGRIALLEAGYPISDIPVLAQVYVIMKQAESYSKNPNNPKAAFLKAVANDIMLHWEKLMDNSPVSEEIRRDCLSFLSSYCNRFDKDAQNGRFSGTIFDNNSFFKIIKGLLDNRINAEITPEDKVFLSDSADDLYEALKTVDPPNVKSSTAFAEFKIALENLKSCDKNDNPEVYNVLKEEAIDKGKAYHMYKHRQLNDAHKKHTRSKLETKRVKMVNDIIYKLENSYDYQDLASESKVMGTYGKQNTMEDKFYQLLLYKSRNRIGTESFRTGMTEEERENAGMHKKGVLTKYQADIEEKLEKQVLKDFYDFAFGIKGDVRNVKDVRKIFEVLGVMNAKIRIEAGKHYDSVRQSLLPEEDIDFLQFKTDYLMSRSLGKTGILYNVLQDTSNTITKNLLDSNVNIYMIDSLEKYYNENVTLNDMLEDLGVTTDEAKVGFLGSFNGDINMGFRDALHAHVNAVKGQISPAELEVACKTMINAMPKNIREVWLDQAEAKVKKTLSEEDSKSYDIGLNVTNGKLLGKVTRNLQENGEKYSEWVENVGKNEVKNRLKNEYEGLYKELSQEVSKNASHKFDYKIINNEEINNISEGIEIYKAGKEEILDVLTSHKKYLLNIPDDQTKPRIEFGRAYNAYKNMTSKLLKAIETISNDTKKPSEIRKALYEYYNAAESFSLERLKTDRPYAGFDRFIFAHNVAKSAPELVFYFDNLRLKLTNDHIGTRNMSLDEISRVIKEYEKQTEKFEHEKPANNQEYKKLSKDVIQKTRIMSEITEKLSHLTSHKLNLSLLNSDPDNIVPSRKKPTSEKLAIDYVITEYIERIKDPVLDAEDMKSLEIRFSVDVVKDEAKELARNPIFKAVALSHPDTYYTEWNRVNTAAEKMLDFNDCLVTKKGLDDINKIQEGILSRQNDEGRYLAISEMIMNQILSNPKNIRVCQAIAAGQLNEKDIKLDIAQSLLDENVLLISDELKGVEQKNALFEKIKDVAEHIKDGSLTRKYIKDVVNNQKPKQLKVVRKIPKTRQQNRENGMIR